LRTGPPRQAYEQNRCASQAARVNSGFFGNSRPQRSHVFVGMSRSFEQRRLQNVFRQSAGMKVIPHRGHTFVR
jgi:hypothetical protein